MHIHCTTHKRIHTHTHTHTHRVQNNAGHHIIPANENRAVLVDHSLKLAERSEIRHILTHFSEKTGKKIDKKRIKRTERIHKKKK